MDKSTAITTIKEATQALGTAITKAIESWASGKAGTDKKRVKVGDTLHAADFLSEYCLAPKGDEGKAIVNIAGVDITRQQAFDSVKLACAHGYLTTAQFNLFTMPANGLAESKKKEKNDLVRKIGSCMRDIRKSLEGKEARAALQAAQDKEDALAKKEGRDPEILTLGGASNKRDTVTFLTDTINKAKERAGKEENPTFDVNKFGQLMDAALLVLATK